MSDDKTIDNENQVIDNQTNNASQGDNKKEPVSQKPLPIPPIYPTDIVQDGVDIEQEKK